MKKDEKGKEFFQPKNLLKMVIAISIVSFGLLALISCGTAKVETLAQAEARHFDEMAELMNTHQIELQAEFERGKQAAFEEGLSEQQKDLYQKGRTLGYTQGIAEGKKEIDRLKEHSKEVEKVGTAKTDDLTVLRARLSKAEGEVSSMELKINNMTAERDTLLSKLRSAMKSLDLYDLETNRLGRD